MTCQEHEGRPRSGILFAEIETFGLHRWQDRPNSPRRPLARPTKRLQKDYGCGRTGWRRRWRSNYGALGDREATIEWLQRCGDTLEDGVLGMKQGREYDFIRDDPRFQAIYRRVGFP